MANELTKEEKEKYPDSIKVISQSVLILIEAGYMPGVKDLLESSKKELEKLLLELRDKNG